MKVEFHFDFGSPNAYLSHLLIPDIESRTGIKFDYIPVLLGGVFKATGNASPMVRLQGILNKSEYQALETSRFLQRHGITRYQPNPHFPVNTLKIMRGAVYASHQPYYADYINAVYEHMWADPKKMDEVDVITAALTESGLPTEAIMSGMQDDGVKQELISNTERAVSMGDFGSPTIYVGNEIFFGKDRLDHVEQEINKQREQQS